MRKEICVLEDELCVVCIRRRPLGTGKWFLVRWGWCWRWTIMSSDNARPSISLCRTLAYGVAYWPADAVDGSLWFTAGSVLSCAWSRVCLSREVGYPKLDSHISFEVAEAQQMGILNAHSLLNWDHVWIEMIKGKFRSNQENCIANQIEYNLFWRGSGRLNSNSPSFVEHEL
jgi:hypothetical protein